MEHGKRETVAGRAIKLWTGAIFAAFLAAAAVYAALLQAEKNVLSEYEKAQAWVAIKDIPAGELLTEANAKEYFAAVLADASLVPETALESGEEAKGLVAVAKIEKGVLLTKGCSSPWRKSQRGCKSRLWQALRQKTSARWLGAFCGQETGFTYMLRRRKRRI